MSWSPWLQFLLLVLATGQLVDLWFNGSIFDRLRAILQPRLYLFTCPYCLTVWVSASLILCVLLPYDIGWYGMMALAAMRASWLLNRIFPTEFGYVDDAPKPGELREEHLMEEPDVDG